MFALVVSENSFFVYICHGPQSATSGWVRGRYRYLLLVRKVAALQRWTRSRSGRAEDRSATNCGKTFCLDICMSFVSMFFFPCRRNNRLGRLIECSKLTCFAREKRHGSRAERSTIDVGCCQAYLRGGERVGRGENRLRTTCPNSEHEEKTIIDTRIQVQTSMSSTAQ